MCAGDDLVSNETGFRSERIRIYLFKHISAAVIISVACRASQMKVTYHIFSEGSQYFPLVEKSRLFNVFKIRGQFLFSRFRLHFDFRSKFMYHHFNFLIPTCSHYHILSVSWNRSMENDRYWRCPYFDIQYELFDLIQRKSPLLLVEG